MKCQIQWIDCIGRKTPDDNPAVGVARIRDKEFPICEDHAQTHERKTVHHQGDCPHFSKHGWSWTVEYFDPQREPVTR